MKKFLLSLCALAIAGACVLMTSCKDDDELATRVNSVLTAIANAQDAGYNYSYVLNGQTFSSLPALQAAIQELPAGSENTLQVVATSQADGTVIPGAVANFTVPQPGQPAVTFPVEVPGATPETVNVTIKTTLEADHSGGSARS